MEIRFEKFDDNILVAHLQCYLDHSGAENFKYVLFERMQEKITVILDLGKLVNIDSFGLDALLATAQRACEMGSKIILACVSNDMQIVLDITKVYKVFEVFGTVEEAIASCRKEIA